MAVPWLEEDPDVLYMRMALEEARRAALRGEVPVGCVIVHPDHGIIGRASNEKEQLGDATAHAEILAIGQASQAVGGWRLTGATLYSTLEPCPMCAGALIQARITRLVYGAADPKAGAVDSVATLLRPGLFNHDVAVTAGVLSGECAEMLSRFFQDRRG